MHVLHYACQHGQLDLLKYIFMNTAFNIDYNIVNDNDWTPLHSASAFGRYEVVKFLFENYKVKGIDVTRKTGIDKTAEDYARGEGEFYRKNPRHPQIVEVLKLWTNEIKEKHFV